MESCSICKSRDNIIFYGNINKYFCRRCLDIQTWIFSSFDLPDEYVHDINYRLKVKYKYVHRYDDCIKFSEDITEFMRVPVCFMEDDFGDDNELYDKSLFSNGNNGRERLILSVKLVSVNRKVAFLGK